MRSLSDEEIGRRLRSVREKANLSRKELADQLGVSMTQMSKYEHGINRMSAAVLLQIAAVIGFSLDEFAKECRDTETTERNTNSSARC